MSCTIAKECGTRTPSVLTSTKLRKHIATMLQMLSLRKHELDLLSAFLGNDIRVHREFYRLPERTLQVAKESKLLLAMERGETITLHGQNFDDIDVDVPAQSLTCCYICKQLLRIVEKSFIVYTTPLSTLISDLL